MSKKPRNEKTVARRSIDETDPIVSACECTGMLPAQPEDGLDACVCRMMNVHPQQKRQKKP